MSIIHDALKKTQENLTGTSAANTPASVGAPLPEPVVVNSPKLKRTTDKAEKHYFRTVTLCICAFACGVIIYSLFHQLKFYLEPPPAPVPQRSTAKPQEPLAILQLPLKKTPAAKTIKLNGIITMGSKPAALINDNVYEEGGEVEGKKIQKILADRVELFDEGTIKSLEVGEQLN